MVTQITSAIRNKLNNAGIPWGISCEIAKFIQDQHLTDSKTLVDDFGNTWERTKTYRRRISAK